MFFLASKYVLLTLAYTQPCHQAASSLAIVRNMQVKCGLSCTTINSQIQILKLASFVKL